MPFLSKRQQRWAFANKMPFARRWAHETGESGKGSKASKRAFSRLPLKVRKGKKK